MKLQIFLLFCLSTVLSACGSSGENLEKLHGKWQIDKVESVKIHPEFGKMSKPMQDEMQSRMPPMELEFDVLGKVLLINVQNKKDKCVFSVEKDKGDEIILSCSGIKFDIKFLKDKIIIFKQAKVKDNNTLIFNKSK